MKRFGDIPSKLTPQSRKRIAARARQAVAEMGLDDLRRARRMSQEALAETMQTTQAHVSRLERRADIYISTLRRYVEALGGELRIVATFRNGTGGELEIARFADLEDRGAEVETTEAPRVLVSYLNTAAFETKPPKAASKRKAGTAGRTRKKPR